MIAVLWKRDCEQREKQIIDSFVKSFFETWMTEKTTGKEKKAKQMREENNKTADKMTPTNEKKVILEKNKFKISETRARRITTNITTTNTHTKTETKGIITMEEIFTIIKQNIVIAEVDIQETTIVKTMKTTIEQGSTNLTIEDILQTHMENTSCKGQWGME